MKVSVEGVNRAYRDRVIECVEAIAEPNFERVQMPRELPTSITFECSSDDADAVVPLVKNTIKGTDWGKILGIRVMPYGQYGWFPKAK